ncbi:MAG TPA: CBS domain-containing protein [Polyangia bacterium]|nr:CBS domain-containing protein [Polyangia bacterium]
MTSRPICVAPDERLDIARALMLSRDVRHLPVIAQRRDGREGALAGILSLGDVVAAASPLSSSAGALGVALREIPVERAMRRPVVTIDVGASVWDAARLAVGRRVSSLPVVDGARLAGIVTGTDFMRFAVERLRAGGDPPSERLMSWRPIATIRPGDGLDLARSIMKASGVRHLPVLDGEQLVGMLSLHDVLRAIGPRPASASSLLEQQAMAVRDAMTAPAVCGSPEDSAADAGAALARRKLGALPLVRRGRLVGMLSVSDFFRYLLESAPEHAAESRG